MSFPLTQLSLSHLIVSSLEALENFIQTHKTLLERTNADIDRLKALRTQVADGSVPSLEELTGKVCIPLSSGPRCVIQICPPPPQLDEPSFKLSEQLDAMPPLPAALDWSVFPGADPTPFSTMATTARAAHAARTSTVPLPAPVPTQAQPSALRSLVAAHRATILDPVLRAFRLPADLAALSSDEEEADPEEARRARERAKIRELKQRRIEGGAFAGLGLGARAHVAGVFIRRDQEDESAEVDISMADDGGEGIRPQRSGAGSADTPATATGAATLPPAAAFRREGATRERRASRKAEENAKNEAAAKAKAKAKGKAKAKAQAKPKAEPGEDEGSFAAPAPEEASLAGKKGKGKSETYKQAWSVSEQHLLERLLEEIPDGEKNRCVVGLLVERAVLLTRRVVRQMAQNFAGDEWASHGAAGGEPRAEVLREAEEVRDRGRVGRQQARCLGLCVLTLFYVRLIVLLLQVLPPTL